MNTALRPDIAVEDYLRKMDRAGIGRSRLTAVRADVCGDAYAPKHGPAAPVRYAHSCGSHILRPQYQLLKERCVGTPFAHYEVEIRRDDGSICDAEEVGELWSRGPVLFSGYWHRPDETAAAVKDGWVSVGDMAKRDADGFLYIVDRKKDMVISGGVNVYPREIEELLLTHPAVADIAVIGVPDEQWGERLRTFAVVRDGHALTAADIASFCAGKLASYKIPKELVLIDALPRNANGKVLKTELRLKD